jgi:hypothetical protein
MPATASKPDPKPEPDPTPAPAKTADAAPAPSDPGAADVPPGRLAPGVYEFTGSLPTQYLEVPLTAHPADDTAPATVFDWPFSAPGDGRWQPTKRKPNQVADNAAPLTSEE